MIRYLTVRSGREIHFFNSLRPNAVVVWLITQNNEDFSLPFVYDQKEPKQIQDKPLNSNNNNFNSFYARIAFCRRKVCLGMLGLQMSAKC